LGVPQHALLIGEQARSIADGLSAFGVAVAHLAVHDELSDYAPRAWARSVAELARTLEPRAALASGSDCGAEVMAYAAALLDAPLAANCVEIVAAEPGDAWTVTRQRWGGSLLEQAKVSAPVKLLTVAPTRSFRTATARAVRLSSLRSRLRSPNRISRCDHGPGRGRGRQGVALGGQGGGRRRARVGGAEGFGIIEELAGLLGGAVGCSRAVTMAGWRPHADQIGQTGTRIAPDLYVACGISGATQHIVGCRAAKKILVINTDPEAPILSQADYAIIGDLRQIVPAISAEIRKAIGG
jgi:electron transfer flavoprotein alpha subunit